MPKYKYYIGIDPGVKTGFAVWDAGEKKFIVVSTTKIHKIFQSILSYADTTHEIEKYKVFVRFEDARKRKTHLKRDNNILQGVGSIKRDCRIIQDFLEDYKIPFQAVAPAKGMTKWKAQQFRFQTGWPERTTSHSRDAALLVWGK